MLALTRAVKTLEISDQLWHEASVTKNTPCGVFFVELTKSLCLWASLGDRERTTVELFAVPHFNGG